jgi:hypothetical protein
MKEVTMQMYVDISDNKHFTKEEAAIANIEALLFVMKRLIDLDYASHGLAGFFDRESYDEKEVREECIQSLETFTRLVKDAFTKYCSDYGV